MDGGAMMPYGQRYQQYLDELKRRLEKLSRTYDLTTMKIFMTVEGLGENNVYSTYDPDAAFAKGGYLDSYTHPEVLPPLVPPPSRTPPAHPPHPENRPVVRGHDPQLMQQLDKLSRTYDFYTMKIFITGRALGQDNVYNIYDPADEKRVKWEPFLIRKEACRLDLTHHDKTREKYQQFLTSVAREEQGKQFFHSMVTLLQTKGAVDIFKHVTPKYQVDFNSSFCGHLCKLFDKKMEGWFDSFEAVNVSLTAHVKVSNFVRVLTGQVDALCRKNGFLYAVNIKVTGMPTPRPMDVNELCLVKAMVIQNGLAPPESVICSLLVCHLGEDRPVLRLWEYRPTKEMDRAIRQADIDNMIDAGKLTQFHELWAQNVCPPGAGSITARLGYNNGVVGPQNNAVAPMIITNGVNNGISNNNNTNNFNSYNNPNAGNNYNRKTPSIVQPMT